MRQSSFTNSRLIIRNSMVNRADLVYSLTRDKLEADELEQAAALLGFEPKIITESIAPTSQQEVIPSTSTSQQSEPESNTEPLTIPDAQFFYLAGREQIASEQEVSERSNQPHSIQVPDFTSKDLTPVTTKAEPLNPLIAWSRLWPVLKKTLHTTRESALNIPGLIEQLAAGRLTRRLPRLQRISWSAQIEILVDDQSRLIPFQSDFDSVCIALQALIGKFNLNVWKLAEGVTGDYQPWGHPEKDPQQWDLPLANTPVLILSDLGMLDSDDSISRRQWLRLGHQLKAAGVTAFVLAPVSAEHIDPELARYFHITLWSNNSRLQRQRQRYQQDNQKSVRRLLVLLSPAIRIEPALLRAVRHCLPADEYDAGCEAQFWLHADVQVSSLACAIRDDENILERYRTDFRNEPESLQRKVIELLRQHHARFFPAIRHEETLIWANLVSENLSKEYQQKIKEAVLFLRKAAKMLWQRQDNPDRLQKDYGLRHLGRSDTKLRETYRYYAVIHGVVNRDKINQGLPLLPGIDKQELSRTLDLDIQKKRNCILYQQGEKIILAEQATQPDFMDIQTNSHYAALLLIGESLFVSQIIQDSSFSEQLLLVDQLPKTLATISTDTESICFQTETEIITLNSFSLPAWASQLGRDSHGLYADLSVKDITQRFRWIAPGTFQVGSPETEKERISNETQHLVILNQGYWLADTACTQALWKAVTGNNPADFNDDSQKPVEQVSWKDSQNFIETLNGLVPELNACLPTEAQWEYACRAGTETPFSFGDNITPEQVNYDGELPYAEAKKGLYRKTTVPVKSLPINAWGLYEMHGNVWEWCQDWYGEYSTEVVTNPDGEEQGTRRVLRGGSWDDDGEFARSAFRGMSRPGSRDDSTGFRLALGQAGVSTRQEKK